MVSFPRMRDRLCCLQGHRFTAIIVKLFMLVLLLTAAEANDRRYGDRPK